MSDGDGCALQVLGRITGYIDGTLAMRLLAWWMQQRGRNSGEILGKK
jgi:hypothetical protein